MNTAVRMVGLRICVRCILLEITEVEAENIKRTTARLNIYIEGDVHPSLDGCPARVTGFSCPRESVGSIVAPVGGSLEPQSSPWVPHRKPPES